MLEDLLPFLTIFIKTINLTCYSNYDQFQDSSLLSYKREDLLNCLSLFSDLTPERSNATAQLQKLIVLFLCPPAPFTNKGISPIEFCMDHLVSKKDLDSIVLLSVIVGADSKGHVASELTKEGLPFLSDLKDAGKGGLKEARV